MRVAIVGAGHVGLVTGAALAALGHDVTCTDVDHPRLAALRAGRPPFYEPGLDRMLGRYTASGAVRFFDAVADAIAGVEVVFLCVGRPATDRADPSRLAVESAARDIARAADKAMLVVNRSTVPPGCTARIAEIVRQERPELDWVVAACPEFLREGHAVRDSLCPHRLVVGADDPRGPEVLGRLYAPVLAHGVRMFTTDPRSAELAKLASNAFLATKVSFANSLARLSEELGADVDEVTSIMGADPRIGPEFLAAGLGYGGYCLPKDLSTLEAVAQEHGVEFGTLGQTALANEQALELVVRKVEASVPALDGCRIALLGLSFKPGTDDVRGSPALRLAALLIDRGACVTGFDPRAGANAATALPRLSIGSDVDLTVAGAGCVVICTAWPEFAQLDLVRMASTMARPVLVDAGRVVDPALAARAGFRYVPIGRPAPSGDLDPQVVGQV